MLDLYIDICDKSRGSLTATADQLAQDYGMKPEMIAQILKDEAEWQLLR